MNPLFTRAFILYFKPFARKSVMNFDIE